MDRSRTDLERLFDGDLRLPSVDVSKIRRVYPVLVLLFPFPQLPFTWEVIGRHPAMSSGGSATSVFGLAFVRRRQIVTAEELEMIEPILLSGVRPSTLLEEKISDELGADLSFKNWLFDKPQFVEQEHQSMKGLLDKVAAAVRGSKW